MSLLQISAVMANSLAAGLNLVIWLMYGATLNLVCFGVSAAAALFFLYKWPE